ncbi:helix-turn-helix domain-containing protein [Fodinicurvata fenggangensis]|uniref:helix-turn-helix domain-containing protein n=1 Tax=Fodinicurvata fenggangensis TaxID=1121830 RepID=UPI0005544FB8|nr:LexA family transcriptional regulator [Fodinicurvata fenggangensis]
MKFPRLVKLIDEAVQARGWSDKAASRNAGLNEEAVRSIKRGHEPSPKTLMALAKTLDIEESVLFGSLAADDPQASSAVTPDHPPLYNGTLKSGFIEVGNEEYASLPRFDAKLSAGPGSLMEQDPEPLGYHLVEAQWLKAITSTIPKNLIIVMVDGYSMEPTFYSGDWVLVDTTQRRVSDQAIFALRVAEVMWIKRLQPMLSLQKIRMISDNERYYPEDLDEHQLQIIGRVVGLVARRI